MHGGRQRLLAGKPRDRGADLELVLSDELLAALGTCTGIIVRIM